jgi:hypothetical protein
MDGAMVLIFIVYQKVRIVCVCGINKYFVCIKMNPKNER